MSRLPLTLLALALGCGASSEKTSATDSDGDGVTAQDGDCDDEDPATFPGAAPEEAAAKWSNIRWTKKGLHLGGDENASSKFFPRSEIRSITQ